MAHTTGEELEAFCTTCPSAEEVTTLLKTFGFELTFHMDIDVSPEYEQIPCLPAQFHFQDEHGNELIFLAGRDVDFDGRGFPEHASRFWLYPGADAEAARWVAHRLAVLWPLTWHRLSQARQDVA